MLWLPSPPDYSLAVATWCIPGRYCHYDEVLTYRGVDYATALQSSKPLAPVEHQLPLMRNLSHLLRG